MIVVKVGDTKYAPFNWDKHDRLYNKILARREDVDVLLQYHPVKMKAMENYDKNLKLTQGDEYLFS